MFVYSKKIILFANEIKSLVKAVLSDEIGLKTHGNRFYGFDLRVSYPIKIVIFNHKNMFGYFDPNFYELGFHECLINCSKEQLRNVVRHELAHYMTFIKHGITATPHSTEFQEFCKQMNWGEQVSRASEKPEFTQSKSPEENIVLRKIEKLMALSKSSNTNEAEQAILKAHQLLLKYNIEFNSQSAQEDKIVLKRILKQKKEDAKMRSIANILETFFVSTVYNRASGFIYLEILGEETNIEIAEYVASFLDNELEFLWKQAQRDNKLRGKIAKNSFFLGLAQGYCKKVQAFTAQYNVQLSKDLIVIENKLKEAKSMVYEHLSSSKSRGRYCATSSALGELMGKQLQIPRGLPKNSTTQDCSLLSYF